MANSIEVVDWNGVIGRALAFLCLSQADMRDKKLSEQAQFLEGLGLPRREAAALLGTTAASISELIRQAKQGNRSRGKKKKNR
jgi:hypothetical protein